jgi:hypothetical protein
MNIFETASRNAFRFPSNHGLITTEDLWDLPLTATNGFSLDSVARVCNERLEATSTVSFVQEEASPATDEWATKLEIVKHIIAIRLQERKDARDASAKKARKERLLEILAAKQDESLQSLSEEEIKAQIDAL